MEKHNTRRVSLDVSAPSNTAFGEIQASDLPPLSRESYAFTSKKLRKKKKQVQATMHEAESLIATELGQPAYKKGRKTFWKIRGMK